MISQYRIAHLKQALGHLYDFEAFLGQGASAAVLLARNKKLGRLEAVKVLRESFDGDHRTARRFVAEAKMVASLDHPNIVKVYDYGEADGLLWCSMQYVDGPTLRAEQESNRYFRQIEVVSLAVPLLDALATSHAAGIVHRDVKLGNILLDSKGRPFLTDFGIAKVKGSSLKTQTGSVLGTPAYISPEQASGKPVDGRSDVYSLGICLFQVLTGKLPFSSKDPLRMLLMRLKFDPPSLSSLREGIDPNLEEILNKALEREPENRFDSAADMRNRLLSSFQHDLVGTVFRVTVAAQVPAPLGIGLSESGIRPLPETRSDESSLTDSSMITEISPRADEGIKLPRSHDRSWRAVVAALLLIFSIAGAGWWLSSRSQPQVNDGINASQKPGPDAPELAPPVSEQPTPSPADSTTEPVVDPVVETDTVEPPELNGSTKPTPEPTTQDSPEVPAPKPVSPATQPPNKTPATSPAPVRRPVTPPSISEQPELHMEAESAAQCRGQEVVLSVTVGEDGKSAAARVLVAADQPCTQAAQKHVDLYRFKPALDYAGEPVSAPLTLSIRFP